MYKTKEKLNFKFPPSSRIKKRKDFIRIQSLKRKSHSAHFLIVVEKREKSSTALRLGITVSKKIDKRAVKRNYIKRRVREIFRLNSHLIKKRGLNILVIAKKGAEKLSFNEIKDELCYMMKKINLCKKNEKSF